MCSLWWVINGLEGWVDKAPPPRFCVVTLEKKDGCTKISPIAIKILAEVLLLRCVHWGVWPFKATLRTGGRGKSARWAIAWQLANILGPIKVRSLAMARAYAFLTHNTLLKSRHHGTIQTNGISAKTDHHMQYGYKAWSNLSFQFSLLLYLKLSILW